MKAVVIDKYGDSGLLGIRETDRPKPGPSDVLIRVRAAGVNPVDWKIRKGEFRLIMPMKFPLILGLEVAGVVEEVGPAAKRFRPGDQVMAALKRPGGYAEYVATPEATVARKPEGLDFE